MKGWHVHPLTLFRTLCKVATASAVRDRLGDAPGDVPKQPLKPNVHVVQIERDRVEVVLVARCLFPFPCGLLPLGDHPNVVEPRRLSGCGWPWPDTRRS